MITTAELEREGYRANDRDRCYHCKSELYDQARRARRATQVCSGPLRRERRRRRRLAAGLAAADEHAVVHPLLEAGVGKDEVRELARALDVPSAEKPASPCLASRIPYGTAVDPLVLAQIDRAELAVKSLGYEVLRVRHYGALGRVELPADSLAALTEELRHAISRRRLGRGLRRGGDLEGALPLGLAQRVVHEAPGRRGLGHALERGRECIRVGPVAVERSKRLDHGARVAPVPLRRHRQRFVECAAAVRARHLELREEPRRLAVRGTCAGARRSSSSP